jgi:hypothetical protein
MEKEKIETQGSGDQQLTSGIAIFPVKGKNWLWYSILVQKQIRTFEAILRPISVLKWSWPKYRVINEQVPRLWRDDNG